MNTAPATLESAPRHRWLLWAGVILAAQIGFIFWLGARHPLAPRRPNAPPPTALAANYNPELAALSDPTLFVLAHPQGFSGAAWKLIPRVKYVAADWDEPLRWLPLPAEKLGAGFRRFVADNPTPPLALTEKTAPPIPALEFASDFFPLPAKSVLRIEGSLAARPLLAPLELKSWPAADVLAASEVRVLVDAGGYVVSAVLLASCGLSAADQRALELARAARFEPWHTVAPAAETPANP
ncbi:MAG: energy transducer TonB [Verrucomicrobia bacterium]|nr:energy transducer TonB [Verrucomicrobiota bacterium]